MSTFRQRMLAKLEERGVSEDAIADQLAQVIRGERTTRTFSRMRDGTIKLSRVQVTRAPKDAALGAMLYDALRDGELGLAPRTLTAAQPHPELYRRFAPKVDGRILQGVAALPLETLTPAAPEASEDPRTCPEPPALESPTATVLTLIAASDEEDGVF